MENYSSLNLKASTSQQSFHYLDKNPFLNPEIAFGQINSSEEKRKLAVWFFNSDIDSYHQKLHESNEGMWQVQGEKKALNLFHHAAEFIPAYKDFLRKHHIDHYKIKSYSDFKNVPLTDKASYISQYPLEDLCWHGKLEASNIVSFSSGSTGKPYLWPRSTYQDYEGAFAFEHLLTYLFQINKVPTLFVNCFSMGNYVAGLYVYTSIKLLSQKGYPLTIVSPGINHHDILNIITHLKSKYQQIILAGYPPFIRDVIDIGLQEGVNFESLPIKFFFASEFFSEDWRDYTLSKVGNYQPITDSTNIYGTADSAIFSFETPTAILIRKLIQNKPSINEALFQSSLVPTLTQYNPLLTFYETDNNRLILTSASGVSLIRYDLRDNGGILTNQEIESTLEKYHINLCEELRCHNIENTRYSLPFVFLTNRSDGAVSFYAIKIFPEYIRSGIEAEPLKKYISGKLSLVSTNSDEKGPQLFVHIELNSDTIHCDQLERFIHEEVLKSLRQHCSEYSFSKLFASKGKRVLNNSCN